MSHMSTLREQFKARNAALRKTKMETLPDSGLTVLFQNMTIGERERAGSRPTDQIIFAQIALCALDPETKKPIWNINDAEHMEEIRALSNADGEAALDIIYRLSALGKYARSTAEGNSKGEGSGNGSGSSSPAPDALPPISDGS